MRIGLACFSKVGFVENFVIANELGTRGIALLRIFGARLLAARLARFALRRRRIANLEASAAAGRLGQHALVGRSAPATHLISVFLKRLGGAREAVGEHVTQRRSCFDVFVFSRKEEKEHISVGVMRWKICKLKYFIKIKQILASQLAIDLAKKQIETLKREEDNRKKKKKKNQAFLSCESQVANTLPIVPGIEERNNSVAIKSKKIIISFFKIFFKACSVRKLNWASYRKSNTVLQLLQ